ncbi:uncharacterized protein LOC121395346 isoform X1 [Xenopus laevis]|uniref:Uncharacterized protein LOC121395346 isoform X1 n=1 Tax=Xenopus laevis TaxID=8355 RepID=A0A8J1L7P8_XENLA|nr:uncharacterized protein LOC121395346 isoform X1 [Xenopus laevis]
MEMSKPNNVINLSSSTLTPSQISLLNKGLNFSPDYNFSLFDTVLDLNRFTRKLTLKRFFHKQTHNVDQILCNDTSHSISEGNSNSHDESDNMTYDGSNFIDVCNVVDACLDRNVFTEVTPTKIDKARSSSFYPIQHRGQYIELFQKLVEQDLEKLSYKTNYVQKKYKANSNISQGEKKALKELSQNKEIIIKNSDKGGSVVVLDRLQYFAECSRQLDDCETYEPLPSDPTNDYKAILETIFDFGVDMKVFTKDQHDEIISNNSKIPIFHALPKVHKGIEHVKGRPIISGIDGLNENLSRIVDNMLQPIVKLLPSYVRDTGHYLNIVEKIDWSPEYSWLTLDVTSLYTSIQHETGMKAIEFWLLYSNIYDTDTQRFILLSIEYLLTHNYFMFDGVFYLQRRGTAMGAKFAPTYANLVMGWWERCNIYGHINPFRHCIKSYQRYIDDLIIIWEGTEQEAITFVEYCNTNNHNLHFTHNWQKNKIEFLDISLKGTINDKIECDVYMKPIMRNTILRADSCHPKSVLRGIPVGQFLRLRRICTTWDAFQDQAMALWDRLLEREYDTRDIKEAYERAVATSRHDLLSRTSNKKSNSKRAKKTNNSQRHFNEKSTLFITPFSSQANQIKKIINRRLEVLRMDPLLDQSVLNNIRYVFKRNRTIASDVSPSLYSHKRTGKKSNLWLNKNGCYKCGKNKCKVCKHIMIKESFNSTVTGKNYPIRSYINCDSKCVIYLATCECGIQYVGRTCRSLKERVREHLTPINLNNLDHIGYNHRRVSAISKHIMLNHNGNFNLIKFQGIELVKLGVRGGDLQKKIDQREVYWIFTLKTRLPQGLNSDWEVSCFL